MRIFVTGTDTGVGKTVFSAAVAGALGAYYWKPIQAGLDEPTDSMRIAELSGLPCTRILSEAYCLETPASPHHAAEIDGIEIDCGGLQLPPQDRLVVEGAGGAMVPLTRERLFADVIAEWGLNVVVVARTSLGTINHSLLTIEALRNRGCLLLGIAFVGEAHADNERTICEFGAVRRLGRLPILDPLNRQTLAAAFAANFDLEKFR